MSKYHRLVEEYQEEINKIKELYNEAEALFDEAEAIDIWDGGPRHEPPLSELVEKQQDLFADGEDLRYEMNSLLERIEQDVEAEYHDVPYRKPRQAGISGFYRESGLKQLFPKRYR